MPSMSTHPHFLTCPRGFEDLAAEELRGLGALEVHPGHGGVRFVADMATVYRVALYSRLGGRLLRRWEAFEARDADALYASAKGFDWVAAFGDARSFSIHVTLASNARIEHAQYAMHRLKDAVVDRFAEDGLRRPDVDRDAAQVQLDLALHADRATVSVDVVGEPLSFRGLRDPGAPAPLRENLAAALLLRAGWPAEPFGEAGGPAFVDPMCGSGTILFEAWMMAADRAPGLLRELWAFEGWPEHDAAAFKALRDEAKARARAGAERLEALDAPFVGSDESPELVAKVREAAGRLGAEDSVRISTQPLRDVRAPAEHGFVVTNPPWGRRLGDGDEAAQTLAQLGQSLRTHFGGWKAAILVGEAGQGHHLGLHAFRRHKVHNGKVQCQLLRVDVDDAVARAQRREEKRESQPAKAPPADLVNRLRKNLKARRKYAKQQATDAYRLYDADLPEYAFAVDIYGDHVHVAEYAPPKTIPEETAGQRRRAALAAIREVTEQPRERVHLKRRERQKGRAQYEAEEVDAAKSRLVVHEGPARFEVQLEGYLDTGLFLDHRPVRAWLREQAEGARFLNLFCYTATATVHAILGGARSSVSVDMSTTYLDWAARNFELNFSGANKDAPRVDPADHRLVRDDVLSWLREQSPADPKDRRAGFDLIFCDPPTFSNSKRMADKFDVQNDHVQLIEDCMRVLRPGGCLVFSTNFRRFKLDPAVTERYVVRDFGSKTVPADFARRKNIHHVFEIRRR